MQLWDGQPYSEYGQYHAMVLFTPESMFACNLGDSRIYLWGENKLRQISTDHVLGRSMVGKAPLTQYLGLPEDLQMLEPSVAEIEHKEGYKYLLCSDGVTDMLSDRENRRNSVGRSGAFRNGRYSFTDCTG